MVNYSNGKIYKIESITGDGKMYIGSTTKKYLSQRMDEHRRHHKYRELGTIMPSTGKPYPNIRSHEIFKLYGVDNCHIVLLESVIGECKEDLLKREAHYIKTLDCVNKAVPLRTDKEYNKVYQIQNKEVISEKKKVKYECECGGTCTITNKAKHLKTKSHKLYMESLQVA